MRRTEKTSLLKEQQDKQKAKEQQEEKLRQEQQKVMEQQEKKIQQRLHMLSEHLQSLNKQTLTLQSNFDTVKALHRELIDNPRIYEFVSKHLKRAEVDDSFNRFLKNYGINEYFRKIMEAHTLLTGYGAYFEDTYKKGQAELASFRTDLLKHLEKKEIEIGKSIINLQTSIEHVAQSTSESVIAHKKESGHKKP